MNQETWHSSEAVAATFAFVDLFLKIPKGTKGLTAIGRTLVFECALSPRPDSRNVNLVIAAVGSPSLK